MERLDQITGIFDSHAHYDDDAFAENRNETIEHIHQNGVCGVVNIGCDDDYGRVLLDGDSLVFYEKVDGKLYQRIAIGRGDDGNYIFTVQNRDETQGVYMDSDGTIRITGNFIGGNIDIETDAKVGRKIILRDKNESTLGYENAAKTAKKAFAENISLKQACVELGFLTEERFDEVFHPEQMV